MAQLALCGGKPVWGEPWPSYNPIGEEEKRAVLAVLDSGVLSGFRGTAGPDFLGGPRVRELEAAWAEHFGVKHAVSMNSLTSGLYACIGAAGIGPGDEVIVSPTTMIASATCAVVYGAIPVFADIDPDTFCLDPASVEARITPHSRAIVPVHLFGRPADLDPLLAIAARHNLVVIEDCAQAPDARYRGAPVGSRGHMAGFSLNYHKTIHTGEGGVVVTNDDELALRLQLIRNHGEAVVGDLGVTDLVNTFGGNYRMNEIEAAIATEQLKKLGWLTDVRVELAAYLTERLRRLPGLGLPELKDPGSRHVYYFYAMRYDPDVWGVPRELLVRAVRAEGIELRERYVRPIYLEPMYQQRVAFANGFPFGSEWNRGDINYTRGLCPAAERAWARELVFGKFCYWPATRAHMDAVADALEKVLEHRRELLALGGS